MRVVDNDPARLDRLKAALDDAVELFGVTEWDPARKRG
jgi:hypothetical protein